MPLMSSDIKLQSIRESSAIGADGILEPTVHIVFMVRDTGPYSVDIPKSTYTANVAQTALSNAASEIVALLDKFPA